MTPETKAKEIVDKYAAEIPQGVTYSKGKISSYGKDYETAKACAIIHVNGIIDELVESVNADILPDRLLFYDQVRQEIEQL
jgi:hypothetical protein